MPMAAGSKTNGADPGAANAMVNVKSVNAVSAVNAVNAKIIEHFQAVVCHQLRDGFTRNSDLPIHDVVVGVVSNVKHDSIGKPLIDCCCICRSRIR